MGPTLVDSSTEDCRKILRRMELETYGAVVSTLRAQGELNKERRKLLEDLSTLMKISPERHKAEVRRAVNDEKLGTIAERLSGGVDTDSGWALEGRRVVPLMPRLVHPTPFTAMATHVSKMVAQNPRICLNHVPLSISVTDAGMTPAGRYVRDPDDEDTLSPVMVPIASPDSSCHSNNNFETDFVDEAKAHLHNNDVEMKSTTKKTVIPVHHPTPVKRPRSPANQVVNASSTPVTKIRAVSPGSARPQQQNTKVVTATQPPQLLLTPRVPSLGASSRPPPPPAHHNHNVSLDRGVGRQRIRVRAPIVHHHNQAAHQPRPSTIVTPSRTAVVTAPRTVPPPSINTQQVSIPVRPPVAHNNNNAAPVKQVVQIRSAPVIQQQATLPKEVVKVQQTITTTASVAAAVQAVTNSVASTIAKTLPGKANVIVLHKNSPMAKSLTAAREGGDKIGVLNKTSFLPKAMSTPTGVVGPKMSAFPGNVRIITVPSVSTPTGAGIGVNSTVLAQKIVAAQAANATSGTQKNVYVLEVTNNPSAPGGKSLGLVNADGVVVSTVTMADLNGGVTVTAAPKMTTSTTSTITAPLVASSALINIKAADILSHEIKSNDGSLKVPIEGLALTNNTDNVPLNNGEHNLTSSSVSAPVDVKENVLQFEHGLLDPATGIIYTEANPRVAAQQSTLDIVSTAITSAGFGMEQVIPHHSGFDDNAGSSRLILSSTATDAFDGASAASSS